MSTHITRSGAHHSAARRLLLVLAVVALVGAACTPKLSTPGSTSSIQLVSASEQDGYRIELYRNTAYPCAISGYQTFAIGYRVGQAATTSAPMWVYMHGGGAGWFDNTGAPMPDAQYKSEESLSTLLSSPAGNVLMPGFMPQVFADPAAFRVVAVSMCDHDFYAGTGLRDPNNPNRQPNGAAITTNGLLATKAAVQFARARLTTSRFFLHGGSAGSVGTYGLAWALQQQGIPPAGIVADSGLLNWEWIDAVLNQGVPCPVSGPMLAHAAEIKARMHPDLARAENEPDKLVSSGRLTVPVMQIWSHGDPYGCQSGPMACPLPDGSSPTMGAMDCMNEPLRRVIAAKGPASRSKSLSLCVTVPGYYGTGDCNYHMVTRIAGTNTDPSSPADYNAAIMDWVHARLGDP